jgi:hypothetical protein
MAVHVSFCNVGRLHNCVSVTNTQSIRDILLTESCWSLQIIYQSKFCPHSSVSIVTKFRTGQPRTRRSTPGKDKRLFCLQTRSEGLWVTQAHIQKQTAFLPRVSRSREKADQPPPSISEITSSAMPPLTHTASWNAQGLISFAFIGSI